jgi:hypothetical protein
MCVRSPCDGSKKRLFGFTANNCDFLVASFVLNLNIKITENNEIID